MADYCHTNKSIATKLNVFLPGCVGQSSNLFMNNLLSDHANTISIVNAIVKKLISINTAPSFILRKSWPKSIQCDTFEFNLQRVASLSNAQANLYELGIDETDDYMLSAPDSSTLEPLIKQLNLLDSVTTVLRKNKITLAGVSICSRMSFRNI